MPTLTEARKREYELTEAEYVDNRVAREVRQYERAVESEKKYIQSLGPGVKAATREKLEWKVSMWGKQLARLQSGEWKNVNTNYLHKEYGKMLKKAISTGQPVPQNIINQAPEYKAAQTARERYEKGWKTSFANRSVAINEQMKEELGYKVKRQDGKPITSAQLEEIAKGVGEVEDVLGPLHDLFDNTDITIVHTSGKHPFLSGVGGTYTPGERAVNIGVDRVKALGHEVAHWLDYESGKVEKLSTRLWSKTGTKSAESTSTAEAGKSRYWGGAATPLGQLIQDATFKINNIREVREYMKAAYAKGLAEEEKERMKLVRERLSPYWREPREVWARLIEQYIATKSGRGGIATDDPTYYEKTPGWWTKEEFAKMLPQVEALMKTRLKVLRGSDVTPPRKTATAEAKLEKVADTVKEVEAVLPPPQVKAQLGPKGELIAKYATRKMSPVTGKDADYVTEYRIVEKPEDAGPEWMGNRWGIQRTVIIGGEVRGQDLIETADSKEQVVKLLPHDTDFIRAEKYGLAKTQFEQRQAEKQTQEEAKKAEEKQEAQDRARYDQQIKELGTRKGVKEGTISIVTFDKDYKLSTRRDVPGIIIGNGIGVAIHGEGKHKTYAVTHLNTGLAMGHEWKSSKEAIALAKAASQLGDWAKYSESKDIPKDMMNRAASLVRGFTAKKLETYKPPQISEFYKRSKKMAKEAEEKSEPAVSINPGDIITDGLVNGRVISEGTIKMGRRELPSYKIVITSGHEAGKVSAIIKEQAKLVKHDVHRTESLKEDAPILPPKPKLGEKKAPRTAAKPAKTIAGVQDKRSARAIATDKALLAKTVVPISKLEVWIGKPNRVDLQGIDTPSSKSGQASPRVAYADKGNQRLSRTKRKGFHKIKLG